MNRMSNQEKVEQRKQMNENKSGFVNMKKFHFVMMLFFIVFLSAGITTFALLLEKKR